MRNETRAFAHCEFAILFRIKNVYPREARPHLRPHPHGRRRAPPQRRCHRRSPIRPIQGPRRVGRRPRWLRPRHRCRGPVLLQRLRPRLGQCRRIPLRLPPAPLLPRRPLQARGRRLHVPPGAHRRRRDRPRRRRRVHACDLPRLRGDAGGSGVPLHERARHRASLPAVLHVVDAGENRRPEDAEGRDAPSGEDQGGGGEGEGDRGRGARKRRRGAGGSDEDGGGAGGAELGRRGVRVDPDGRVPGALQGGGIGGGRRRGEGQGFHFQALSSIWIHAAGYVSHSYWCLLVLGVSSKVSDCYKL
ncbi:hypothetical protein Cni_G08030 [Canna indica]|uniref:Uncharacterized protein n=1 Tax=Canna indica TaxID=4628 RepID=A0AAQ3JZU1_9LILI|nr:hypothetical protein Cni_G08030 [Canna indica]